MERKIGYYLVEPKNYDRPESDLGNYYQPINENFAPMYWDGCVFINCDEIIWREDELNIKERVM